MNKTKRNRNLTTSIKLSRETVRILSDRDARQVAGGFISDPNTCVSQDTLCPVTVLRGCPR